MRIAAAIRYSAISIAVLKFYFLLNRIIVHVSLNIRVQLWTGEAVLLFFLLWISGRLYTVERSAALHRLGGVIAAIFEIQASWMRRFDCSAMELELLLLPLFFLAMTRVFTFSRQNPQITSFPLQRFLSQCVRNVIFLNSRVPGILILDVVVAKSIA